MAITESGMYVQNFVDTMDATQLAFNYIGDDMRCALVTDAAAPNFSTHTAWADISASEVAASGSYASKGDLLTAKTLAVTAGDIVFDCADPAYTTATISAMAVAILDDTLASPLDALICLLDFVTLVSSTAGTFTVAMPTGGFIQIPHV